MVPVLPEYVHNAVRVVLLGLGNLDGNVVDVLLEQQVQLGLDVLLSQLDQPEIQPNEMTLACKISQSVLPVVHRDCKEKAPL